VTETDGSVVAGGVDARPAVVDIEGRPRPIHERVIQRNRLLRRLDAAEAVRLVLVACPAGYGKTTLLADWAASRLDQRTVAWVSLDERDNDPVVFWVHLVRALRRACPGLGDGVADEVTAPSLIMDRMLPRLLQVLAEQPAMTLVLDDVHVLEPGVARDMLRWLLDHQPAAVQLVLSTRAEPALPLGRLRAQGNLLELRAGDLRFTPAEGSALLNERDLLGLAPEDVVSLVERTEGWPAGLYLASLSLAAAADRHALVASFGASNRHVVDFLVEEVMDSFDKQMQDFMVRTSVLDSLNGPLCDAVLQRSGSQGALAELARTNLFVIPLDDEGVSYRYHHMFGQLLGVQLHNREPGLAPALHRRAMTWYREHDAIHEAITQALDGGDVDAAADILTSSWLSFFNAYRYAGVLGLLRRFPAARLDDDPALLLIQAWALSFCGAHAAAAPVMDRLESSFPLDAGPVAGFSCMESGLMTLRGIFPNGDVGAQLANAGRVAELESPQSRWWPVSQYALGVGSYFAGDLAAADKSFSLAQVAGVPAGQTITVATAIAYRSVIAGELGNDPDLQRYASEASEFAAEHGLQHPLGAVRVAVGLAAAARGDHQYAIAQLDDGVEFLRTWREPLVLAHALIRLADVLRAVGDSARVPSLLAEARAIVDSCPDPRTLADRLGNAERASAQPAVTSRAALTARERDVLRRLDSADSEAEIAATLFVSFNTLHAHVRSAYRKLGVTSRADAVGRAKVLGVIDESRIAAAAAPPASDGSQHR